MSVASPKGSPLAKPPLAALPKAAVAKPERPIESWVGRIRWVAIAVFTAIPIFCFFVQSLAGRVVWTLAVASLPLFIVLVGYHRWRNICPLAVVAQLPIYLKRPGRRKASRWLEANYYYVAFTIFFFSLWMRLIATNGDGRAIAIFFVLLSLAAFIVGALYTGKTWCNYICPVSFIEKIYTEPYGLRATANSQCAKCTACKKHCPDINEENAYWKELDGAAKRTVCFAFPGIVFAFYFYYYLQSGTWDYYFNSVVTADNKILQWVDQPGLIWSAFSPGRGPETAGFFFLPRVPRAVASLVTLAAGGMAAFLLFRWIESLLGRRNRRRAESDRLNVRHTTLTLAAFTAFVTFYTFAAQPTLRKVEWLPHFFGLVVVAAATLTIVRRLPRTQTAFSEEALGRNIIKRWQWPDEQPPRDLHEAFLVHTIRQRESARSYDQLLEAYGSAVRETLAEGYITRNEVQFLQSLRNQLQIKEADHEKVMAALAEEERSRITDPSEQLSAEKRLQLKTYTHALESYFARVGADDAAPDDTVVRQLRSEYRVTRREHAIVLDSLLGGAGGTGKRLANELAVIEEAVETIRILEGDRTRTNDFLIDLLCRRRDRAADRLIRSAGFAPDDDAIRNVRDGLCNLEAARRKAALEEFSSSFPPGVADRLIAFYREIEERGMSTRSLTDRLLSLQECVDNYIRAVVLISLSERDALTTQILDRFHEDESEIVRDTAGCLRNRGTGEFQTARRAGLSIVEKMIALRSAPIFATLAPEELAELARFSKEEEYGPENLLCSEGTQGNEVFILLRGDVKVLRKTGQSEVESTGSLIGEMAVLDPAPRAATVVAGSGGANVLRLDGAMLRNVVNKNPAVAHGVIQTLTRRLRRT